MLFDGPITAGTKLPGIPKNTFSFALDQTVPLSVMSRPASLKLHVDGAYRSATTATILTATSFNWTIPQSFSGNARATFAPGGPLTYDLFVKISRIARATPAARTYSPTPNYSRDRYIARPRTIGSVCGTIFDGRRRIGCEPEVSMRFPTSLLAAFALVGLVQAGAGEAAVVPIDPHALYPEGPLWDQGRLLFVEYAGPGIKSWDGRAVRVWWRRDHCGANALIHFRGDHILVACYDGNYLVELDAAGKELRTFDKDSAGKPFVGPNDFCSDGHGGVYFSASGVFDIKAPITGAVLHMSADGQDIREVADTIHYSNGLTLAKDGKHLLVAEMLAGRILSFPIGANGILGPRTVWARLQDLAPPTPERRRL